MDMLQGGDEVPLADVRGGGDGPALHRLDQLLDPLQHVAWCRGPAGHATLVKVPSLRFCLAVVGAVRVCMEKGCVCFYDKEKQSHDRSFFLKAQKTLVQQQYQPLKVTTCQYKQSTS